MSPSAITTESNAAARRVVQTNEKVTGPPSLELIRQSGILQAGDPSEHRVLDNATGGGVLAFNLLTALKLKDHDAGPLGALVAADIDEGMLGHVKERCLEENIDGIETAVADQQRPPFPDSSFTHIFNNFGVFFSSDEQLTLQQTHRLLKPRGTVGFTTWKAISWWPAVALPALAKHIPDAPPLPNPGSLFPTSGWNDPQAIPAKLTAVGFQDVVVQTFSFTPEVDPVDFAAACALLVRVVASKGWNAEVFQKYSGQIEEALLSYLRETWPEGKWDGQMTAIITTARK